ncbi:signal peptidase I [Candidatus Gottesmanbacteria bacterium]|nr:signal peptidase I [Candidatus Gottesmanbacteria bacterium]
MFDLVKRIGAFFLDAIETVVIALAIFVVIYLFLIQPHQVKGSSMYPNFIDGEYILTDKISYRLHLPQRGDVIVFKAPKDHEIDFIKRIIGLPGEVVKVSGGFVYINEKQLSEVYLPKDYVTKPGSFLTLDQNAIVAPDEYFVLGDNRSHSSDSREWGFVKKEEIIGKAWFRYWPVSQLGFVPKVKYSLSF